MKVQWRVGTMSMGVALVLLGAVLFISQWKGMKAFDALIVWWPVIFILLGLELLAYLAFMKKDNPVVKYDIFSVLFVVFLSSVSIVVLMLTSSGLLTEIRHAVGAVERTKEIVPVDAAMSGAVKRIVVQNEGQHVQVDRNTDRAVHVFGSYQGAFSDEEAELLSLPDDAVTVRTIGDTMYVRIHQPPRKLGLSSSHAYLNLTVVLPEGVPAQFEGGYRFIENAEESPL